MTTGPLDPKEEAARAVFLAEMKVADEDPLQAARLAATCAALVAVFGGLSQSLMTARTIFHLHGFTTKEMPKIEQGQFLALSLLAGTADSLARAVIALIGGGNLYAASALLRQIVEIEYLGWAFANDPDEVVDWYSSTHDDRLKRWQPRHLRDRSGGKFRGKDYAEHCETGGHPTPAGMRNLLHGDGHHQAIILTHELAHHGVSAWRYLTEAIGVICDEHGIDPVEVVPVAETLTMIETEADWRKHDLTGSNWADFNRARDRGFMTE
jgi:hypothetical protein